MRLSDMNDIGFAPPPFKPDGALAQIERIEELKQRLARWAQDD